MKKINAMLLIVGLLASTGASAAASTGTTLACKASKQCDGYLNNCVSSDFSFVVHIEPKSKTVAIDKVIPADFTNPAEVSFRYLNYGVKINRYELSAVLFNENEVIETWCKKTDAGW